MGLISIIISPEEKRTIQVSHENQLQLFAVRVHQLSGFVTARGSWLVSSYSEMLDLKERLMVLIT